MTTRDRAAYKSTTLREMIRSWESLVSATEAVDQSVNTVHGVLKHYDLPDLRKMIGTRALLFAARPSSTVHWTSRSDLRHPRFPTAFIHPHKYRTLSVTSL